MSEIGIGTIPLSEVMKFNANMRRKNKQTKKVIVHRNSCGDMIYDKNGNFQVTCGEDLDSDGDTGAFAQCGKCREKDYTDVGEEYPNKLDIVGVNSPAELGEI